MKSEVEVTEYKVAIYFSSKFTDTLKSIHGPPRGPWTPG